MIALFILLCAIAISFFINRIAAKALMLTGLSRDVAEFQARSIVTGTGFTTDEAENIVNHPARRRLVMPLMLIQNAGLVTVISTFVLSFVNTESTSIAVQRGLILTGGLALLLYLSQNKWIEHQLEKLIDWSLNKYTELKIVDIRTLLNFQEGYTVSRFTVEENSWLTNKPLKDLNLKDEGILVLSIQREDDTVICAPMGGEKLYAGDELSVFGKEENLNELKYRLNDAAGNKAHEDAKREYRKEKVTL